MPSDVGWGHITERKRLSRFPFEDEQCYQNNLNCVCWQVDYLRIWSLWIRRQNVPLSPPHFVPATKCPTLSPATKYPIHAVIKSHCLTGFFRAPNCPRRQNVPLSSRRQNVPTDAQGSCKDILSPGIKGHWDNMSQVKKASRGGVFFCWKTQMSSYNIITLLFATKI